MSLSHSSGAHAQDARFRVHKPLVLSIAVLACVELLVARNDRVWDYVPRSQAAMIGVLERMVLANVAEPEVVVMGSSRARDAVSPRALERYAGIPTGRVVNLGMTGGTPFDALALYRRNRDKLSHSRLLVVSLELWDFGTARPAETQRRYATLRDRLQLSDREYTLSLLAGWVWRTWDAQQAIRRLAQVQGSRLLRGEGSVHNLFIIPGLGSDGRFETRSVPKRDTTVEAIRGVADVTCAGYEPGVGRFRQAQELIDLAASDGVPVLLVLFPTHTEFRDTLRSRYPAVYADFHRRVRLLTGARLKLWETPAEAGLQDGDFEDYGHMNARGADRMSAALARTIKQWYPEVVAQGEAIASRAGEP